MTIENFKLNESREREPILDVNILSLNRCETIDEMVERIETAKGVIDTVLLGEYNFEVEEVLNDIEKIKNTAEKNKTTIILTPDNQFGRKATWNQINQEFVGTGATIEQTDLPDDYIPETVGVYVDPSGFIYVFPKTWERMPVHRIPNTNIGVTICGEINNIKPEHLEGVRILYNPSREGDDPFLRFRMLHRYGDSPLTREKVGQNMLEHEYYSSLLDDSKHPQDDDYDPVRDTR